MNTSQTIDFVSLRSQNIEKNQDFLRQLGLDDHLGRRYDSMEKKIKREGVSFQQLHEPKRKSARLLGNSPDHVDDSLYYDYYKPSKPAKVSLGELEIHFDEEGYRRPITAIKLREYIDASNPEHQNMISDEVFLTAR
jgi:hypothetical protein